MDLHLTDPDQLKRALWVLPFNPIEPVGNSVLEGNSGFIGH